MTEPFTASPQFFRALIKALENWEPQDREVILEGRIEGFGVDAYYRNSSSEVDPYAWVAALEQEKQQREIYYKALTDEHGFPETSGMPPEQAHITRLSYLMTKYPHADWALLLDGAVRVSSDASKPSRVIPLRRDTTEERIEEGIEDSPVELENGLPESVPTPVPAIVPESVPRAIPDEPARAGTEPRELGATMSAQDVAAQTGLAYATVIRFLKSGELPYGKKLGTKWTVPTAPFLEWLNDSRDTVRNLGEPKPRQGGKPLKKEPVVQPEIRHGWSAPF